MRRREAEEIARGMEALGHKTAMTQTDGQEIGVMVYPKRGPAFDVFDYEHGKRLLERGAVA